MKKSVPKRHSGSSQLLYESKSVSFSSPNPRRTSTESQPESYYTTTQLWAETTAHCMVNELPIQGSLSKLCRDPSRLAACLALTISCHTSSTQRNRGQVRDWSKGTGSNSAFSRLRLVDHHLMYGVDGNITCAELHSTVCPLSLIAAAHPEESNVDSQGPYLPPFLFFISGIAPDFSLGNIATATIHSHESFAVKCLPDMYIPRLGRPLLGLP